jgi:hypothetical protein
MSAVFEDVRIVVDGVDEFGKIMGQVAQALKSIYVEHGTIYLALLSRDEPDIWTSLRLRFVSTSRSRPTPKFSGP